LGDIELSLNTLIFHAKDCEDRESDPTGRMDIIERQINLKGDLTPE
jgi:hypothetical protein